MHHHAKNKGDIGVLKAQADLAAQGYTVLLPLTEHAPFDLVIYQARKFQRVQVKYRSCCRNGCLDVHSRSVWNDRNGSHTVPMDKREVDIIGVYCPDTDECYYFNPARFRHFMRLRVKATKNNQRAGVKRQANSASYLNSLFAQQPWRAATAETIVAQRRHISLKCALMVPCS
jgi:hypothetical protein